jgi:alpha-ketoglutarate-dependent taurine dioxygenase
VSTEILDSTNFEVTNLTSRIGVEVKTDVETLLSGRYASCLRELLEQRGVLVFREINLNDDQQKAFTRTLGELSLQAGKEFMNISLDKAVNDFYAEYQKATFFWHIDMMYWEVPQLASLLTARVLSKTGGDTEFANTYASWEDLPEEDRQEYQGLRVMHSPEAAHMMYDPEPSLAHLDQWRRTTPSCAHPLVWTHRSGRKSLLIGATANYVLNKSPEESRYLLTKLRDWATQPSYVYRHKWRVGDLVIWDNTGTMHRALPYPADSGRLMRRTALKGEEAIA